MQGLAQVRQTEWHDAQVGTQFQQVLAPRFLALGILRPTGRVDVKLLADPSH